MEYTPISKPPIAGMRLLPNLSDYEKTRASWSWDAVRGELDGLPGGGLNIAYEAIDRHAKGARRTSRRSSGRARTASRRRTPSPTSPACRTSGRTSCAASACRRATASSSSSTASRSSTRPSSAR